MRNPGSVPDDHQSVDSAMFDISRLPLLLERAGLVLQDSGCLTSWDTFVNCEISQRLQQRDRKRTLQIVPVGDTQEVGDYQNLRHALCDSDSLDIVTTQNSIDLSNDNRSVPESQDIDDVRSFASTQPSSSVRSQHRSQSLHSVQEHAIQLVFPEKTDVTLQPARNQLVPHANSVVAETQDMNLLLSQLIRKTEAEQHMTLDSLTKAQLVSFGLHQLVLINTQTNQIASFRHEARMDKQRVRRAVKKQMVMKDKMFTMQNSTEDMNLEVLQKGKKKVSWRGAISLGLRKSISYVSASSFPNAALIQVGRNTVIRAEILVNAFLITRTVTFHRILYLLLEQLASSQRHHCGTQSEPDARVGRSIVSVSVDTSTLRLNETECIKSHDDALCQDLQLPPLSSFLAERGPMVSSGDKTVYSLGLTFWANDATNASIWQRNKLQGLMTWSSIMIDWHALCQGNYADAFRSHKAMHLSREKNTKYSGYDSMFFFSTAIR